MAQVITHPRRTWPTKQVEPIVVVAAAAVGEHLDEEEEVVFAKTVVVAPSLTTDQNANCVSGHTVLNCWYMYDEESLLLPSIPTGLTSRKEDSR
jgi:hypothetical protein